jgi:adenosylcobinamide hydrolase
VSGSAPSREHRSEGGRDLPMLVWRFDEPVRAISSAPAGGGIGPCHWLINATVDRSYARRDPDVHIAELARGLGLGGPGAGLITAVDVGSATTATDGGVTVTATVGLGHPTWAAAPDGDLRHGMTAGIAVGTINIVAFLPVALTVAGLVNAVITATEAKAQALWDYGGEATGTASDALFIGVGPSPTGPDTPPQPDAGELFAGPRSRWGARLARAVHSAVGRGTAQWLRDYAG